MSKLTFLSVVGFGSMALICVVRVIYFLLEGI